MERVHAAVLGAHVRSECMLPLEMYLEEGIPLVCYIRDQPYAELVETSEQSCHAFLSFSFVGLDCIKVQIDISWKCIGWTQSACSYTDCACLRLDPVAC